MSMGHLPGCDALWKVFAYLLFGIGRSPAAMETFYPNLVFRSQPADGVPINSCPSILWRNTGYFCFLCKVPSMPSHPNLSV